MPALSIVQVILERSIELIALSCSRTLAEPSNGIDLPDGPPPVLGGGAPGDRIHTPLVLGSVDAGQRGVAGQITLDVHMDVRGEWLEIGPLRFSRREAICLFRLLLVGQALLRAPAAQPDHPPWEGETRL